MNRRESSQKTALVALIQAKPGKVPTTKQELERYGEPRQRMMTRIESDRTSRTGKENPTTGNMPSSIVKTGRNENVVC